MSIFLMSQRLKTIVLSALGALLVFSSITYTSCKRDKCKEITCAFGATCVEGVCYCPTGYEGSQCEKIIRSKFIGAWNVTESGTMTTTEEYTLSVSEGITINTVKIHNFNNHFGPGYEVSGYVSDDTLYIPKQYVDSMAVEGRGYLAPSQFYQEHGEMIVHYYVLDTAANTINDFGWDLGKPAEWVK